MEDLYFDCGSYEKNRAMADHIRDMTSGNPVTTSSWHGHGDVCLDMDDLARERPEVQRAVLDIAANFRDD